MNFIMIGLLLREALDRLCVRLNMYRYLVMICDCGFKQLRPVTRLIVATRLLYQSNNTHCAIVNHLVTSTERYRLTCQHV